LQTVFEDDDENEDEEDAKTFWPNAGIRDAASKTGSGDNAVSIPERR
jgi:hypothetical protein